MSSDANIILNILYPLVPFYIAYIISSFIDGWFISKGKTYYNTINSFLVNIVYYGIAFILFNKELFELNIMFVILLFGFGNVVHMLISIVLYMIETRQKVNIK
jgi:Na+-driven multidrug efflux pump